jgi:hypothetical protein
MVTRLAIWRQWLFLPLLWLLVSLACNAPVGQEPAVEPPPTPSLTVTAVPSTPPADPSEAPATIPILLTAIMPEEPEATPALLPTFTPIAGPTLAATPTATTASAAPTSPATPRPGSSPTTPPAASGPLDFSYNISWQLTAGNPFVAVARVTIQATGGSGVYTYYHDDILQSGPTFEYNWAACRGNPGSLKVDSSDGQSVRKNYFENPPCPTPTPPS